MLIGVGDVPYPSRCWLGMSLTSRMNWLGWGMSLLQLCMSPLTWQVSCMVNVCTVSHSSSSTSLKYQHVFVLWSINNISNMIILIRFHYTEYQRQNESDFFTLLTKKFSKFSGTHKYIILLIRNKNFQLLMPQAGI